MWSPQRLAPLLFVLPFVGCVPGVPPSVQGVVMEELSQQAMDAMIGDLAECPADDAECTSTADRSGEEVAETAGDGAVRIDEQVLAATNASQTPNEVGGAGEASNRAAPEAHTDVSRVDEADAVFDFVPGDRVLFEDDYLAGNVGGFPRLMTLRSGDWDVIERDDRRWLRNTGPRRASVALPLAEDLPRAFTMEFDVHFSHANQRIVVATTVPGELGYASLSGNAFQVGVDGRRTGVIALGGSDFVESLSSSPEVAEGPVPIRIAVDGSNATVYVGTRRVAHVVDGAFERGSAIYLENAYFASATDPLLIGPIRVAASSNGTQASDLTGRASNSRRFSTTGGDK